MEVALSAGSTGQLVEFKANGDAKGRYTIYQFQRINGTNTYKYVPIGNWQDRYDSITVNCSRPRLAEDCYILLVLFFIFFSSHRFFDVPEPEPILAKRCHTTQYSPKLIVSYGLFVRAL